MAPSRRANLSRLSAVPAPDTIANMAISVTAPRGLAGLAAPLRVLIRRVLASEGRRIGDIIATRRTKGPRGSRRPS